MELWNDTACSWTCQCLSTIAVWLGNIMSTIAVWLGNIIDTLPPVMRWALLLASCLTFILSSAGYLSFSCGPRPHWEEEVITISLHPDSDTIYSIVIPLGFGG